MRRSSCQATAVPLRFQSHLNSLNRFAKNSHRQVTVELLRAENQDNFVNVHKNGENAPSSLGKVRVSTRPVSKIIQHVQMYVLKYEVCAISVARMARN